MAVFNTLRPVTMEGRFSRSTPRTVGPLLRQLGPLHSAARVLSRLLAADRAVTAARRAVTKAVARRIAATWRLRDALRRAGPTRAPPIGHSRHVIRDAQGLALAHGSVYFAKCRMVRMRALQARAAARLLARCTRTAAHGCHPGQTPPRSARRTEPRPRARPPCPPLRTDTHGGNAQPARPRAAEARQSDARTS